MKKIVKVKKFGSNLEIELDANRIVAITEKTKPNSDEECCYYIYFENAVWRVQSDSYDAVRTAWIE